MEQLIIITVLLAICVYGFFKISIKLKKQNENLAFAASFLEKLKSYVSSEGRNLDDYGWMIHRSNKMQNQMGSLGILHSYRPPYQNIIYNDYPIILNMLPDLRSSIQEDVLRSVAYQYANALQEALVRHIGCIDDNLESYNREIKNPFKWFREGVREIVVLPAYLLSSFGIVSESFVGKLISSVFFKVISGLIALLGFVSAIVTIVIGWEEFVKKLSSLLISG